MSAAERAGEPPQVPMDEVTGTVIELVRDDAMAGRVSSCAVASAAAF